MKYVVIELAEERFQRLCFVMLMVLLRVEEL